jgi:cobalt-zinc-cadmium efflux system protein
MGGHPISSPEASVAGHLRPDCTSLPPRFPAYPLTRLGVVLALTIIFMLVEAIGGLISGSLALLADAGHMLTDAGALGLSLLSAWIALRPASASKTYGYQRWEILAALINGAALFGIAAWVILEAVQRIQHPQPIRAGLFLVVAAGGLLVNLVSLAILHGIRKGSLNTRGAYLHVLGDALGSVGALSAAAIILLTGWTLADPIISIALALLILVGAWRLLRESTDILLEGVPGNVSMAEVQRCMLGVSGVTAVHDLHVWTVTSGLVAMSGHAIVPQLGSHPEVLDRIRSEMARLGIGHVTIQLEVQHECEEPPVVAGTAVAGHLHHPGHRH